MLLAILTAPFVARLGAAKMGQVPNKVYSSVITWAVKFRPLSESSTLGLLCLENRNFRRKDATFTAKAVAKEEASTHLIRWLRQSGCSNGL